MRKRSKDLSLEQLREKVEEHFRKRMDGIVTPKITYLEGDYEHLVEVKTESGTITMNKDFFHRLMKEASEDFLKKS